MRYFKKVLFLLLIIFTALLLISCKTDEDKFKDLENKISNIEKVNNSLIDNLNKIIIDNETIKNEYDSLNNQINEIDSTIENLKDLIDDVNDISLSYNDFNNRIEEIESKVKELETKINNLLESEVDPNYKNAYTVALNEYKEYSNYMKLNNLVVNDGLIIKVILDKELIYYFVLYNDLLKEFKLDNTNDDFDVYDCNSSIYVDFSYGKEKCDRYFCLPKLNGIDKLTNENDEVLYFYYYYGTTVANELTGNNGSFIDYPDQNDNCYIYNGIISTTNPNNKIKNIIFMIPDGAGFGSYDLASMVKKSSQYGIYNALTKTTTDRIEGKNISSLYLDEYMIGTSSTALYNGELTDSGAGGTALSSGYKTNYCAIGVNHEYLPKANILEVCMLEGKSTGVVTTKSWIDATPSAFLSHSYYRTEQKDLSYQSLNSNVDVLLAYGTSNGSKQTNGNYLHTLDAYNKGYTVVNNKNDLYEEVYLNKSTKIWSNFTEGSDNEVQGADVSGYHISYDVYGQNNELSLLDMAKSALDVLNTNINDEDGFFLMIEGGAIDNAAHGRSPLETCGEYLAYDETFAYMVNFASKRDDTIVISVPDHDTGGFINPNDKLSILLENITNGNNLDGYVNNTLVGVSNDHTMQNVPLCFYGPENIRDEFLLELGIPNDASSSKVRSGNYYDGTVINEAYEVLNSSIAPAILKICNLMTFDDATSRLFVNVNNYGSYDSTNEIFTFNNGMIIKRNDNYFMNDNQNISLDFGRGIYIINPNDNNLNSFYMPKSFVDKYLN